MISVDQFILNYRKTMFNKAPYMKIMEYPTLHPILTTFKQKDTARKIIHQRTLYSAGVGFLPLPVLDVIGITSIQLWMIRDIARVYDIPFERHLVKSFIGSVVSNLGAYGLVKSIPIVGFMLGGSVVALGAATTTYTLGKIFMQHFDQGGTLLDFNPSTSRAYFYKQYETNQKIVQQMQQEEWTGLQENEKQNKAFLSLQYLNQQLVEEEQLHTELHEEAEQFISELHQALKEQELDHLTETQQYQEKIDLLETANGVLQSLTDFLKHQLEEQSKRCGLFCLRSNRA